jgi:hypothetical protein
MKHARIPLDGELVTAALPDPIVTVTGAMRHSRIIRLVPVAYNLQERFGPHPCPPRLAGEGDPIIKGYTDHSRWPSIQ